MRQRPLIAAVRVHQPDLVEIALRREAGSECNRATVRRPGWRTIVDVVVARDVMLVASVRVHDVDLLVAVT
jgi:hypothetical protein